MTNSLWNHHLRSSSAVTIALVSSVVDISLAILGLVPLYELIVGLVQGSVSDAVMSTFILSFGLVVVGTYHAINSTRYWVLRLTIKYSITPTELHFEYGYPKRIRKSIPLNISRLHPIRYDHGKWTTLLVITNPPVDFNGFDFESNEERQWPSIEMVEHPESVAQIIGDHKKVHQSLSKEERIWKRTDSVPIPVQWKPAIVTSLGALYLAISLCFIVYAIDVKILPCKTITDQVTSTERILGFDGKEIVAVQKTVMGYCFKTYSLMAEENSTVTLQVSPILGLVTDVHQNQVSYRHKLVGALNGSIVFLYFITCIVMFLSGMYIVRQQGIVSGEHLYRVTIAPIGLILLSLYFLSVYGI